MSTIWEIAKGIEEEGKAFYEKMAAENSLTEMKSVFDLLAAAEQKHWDLFDSFEKSMPAEAFAADTISEDVANVFKGLAQNFAEKEVGLEALADTETLYNKALDLENKSVEYYTELQDKVSDNLQKSVIGQILTEEKRHQSIVRGLKEFVHRPKEWVEDAEFTHLEDY